MATLSNIVTWDASAGIRPVSDAEIDALALEVLEAYAQDTYVTGNVLFEPFEAEPTSSVLRSDVYALSTTADPCHFNNDGTQLFVAHKLTAVSGSPATGITVYDLLIPYDVTTIEPSSATEIAFDTQISSPGNIRDFKIVDNGSKLYLLDQGTSKILYYQLTTPWDMSSRNFISSETVRLLTSHEAHSFDIDDAGEHLFVLTLITDVGVNTFVITYYDITTPYDITTAAYVNELRINIESVPTELLWRQVRFNPTGTTLLISTAGAIYEWPMSTPFVPPFLGGQSGEPVPSVYSINSGFWRFAREGSMVVATGNPSANYLGVIRLGGRYTFDTSIRPTESTLLATYIDTYVTDETTDESFPDYQVSYEGPTYAGVTRETNFIGSYEGPTYAAVTRETNYAGFATGSSIQVNYTDENVGTTYIGRVPSDNYSGFITRQGPFTFYGDNPYYQYLGPTVGYVGTLSYFGFRDFISINYQSNIDYVGTLAYTVPANYLGTFETNYTSTYEGDYLGTFETNYVSNYLTDYTGVIQATRDFPITEEFEIAFYDEDIFSTQPALPPNILELQQDTVNDILTIQESNDRTIFEDIADRAIDILLDGGPGTVKISTLSPALWEESNGLGWILLKTIQDKEKVSEGVTTYFETYYVYKKITQTGSVDIARPLKLIKESNNDVSLEQFSDADISILKLYLQDRINTTRLGTYAVTTTGSAPTTGGLWEDMGSIQEKTQPLIEKTFGAYTGTYATDIITYAGEYTADYNNEATPYGIIYTADIPYTKAENYFGTYAGPVEYVGIYPDIVTQGYMPAPNVFIYYVSTRVYYGTRTYIGDVSYFGTFTTDVDYVGEEPIADGRGVTYLGFTDFNLDYVGEYGIDPTISNTFTLWRRIL